MKGPAPAETTPDLALSPAAARTQQEAPADLGILLVHGIGEQRQGETLSKVAEPIVEWIRNWLYQELPSGTAVGEVPIRGRLKPPLLAPDTPPGFLTEQ